MKILPASRAARIRFAVILGLLVGTLVFFRMDRVAGYWLSEKHEGDILFQSLPKGALVNAIEGISQSEWSHCGILMKRDGHWVVAEAIGHVHYTPLYAWIVRGRRSNLAAYRVKNLPPDVAGKLQIGVKKLLGRSYDFRYAPDDDEIYCSELVYKVYDRELGIRIGTWQKLGDLNWKPYAAFIEGMEAGKLPLDRLMITPVGLTVDKQVERVF